MKTENKRNELDHRRAVRRYAKKKGREIPEWAKVKKKPDPLAEPEKVTYAKKEYARRVARKRGVPIPEWARLIPIEAHLAEPPNPTSEKRQTCRSFCARHGIPVPEWAKVIEKIPQNPLDEPAVSTVYARCKCRDYCRKNGIQIPEWAKIKRKIYDFSQQPNEEITPKLVWRCREYCAENGIPVPEWAHTDAEIGRGRMLFCRSRYTAAGALCEIDLALWSGMESFWERALRFAEYLKDDSLLNAVRGKSPSAHDEAYRVCREIDPLFGRHVDCADGIDHRQFNTSNMVKGNKQQYVVYRKGNVNENRHCGC